MSESEPRLRLEILGGEELLLNCSTLHLNKVSPGIIHCYDTETWVLMWDSNFEIWGRPGEIWLTKSGDRVWLGDTKYLGLAEEGKILLIAPEIERR